MFKESLNIPSDHLRTQLCNKSVNSPVPYIVHNNTTPTPPSWIISSPRNWHTVCVCFVVTKQPSVLCIPRLVGKAVHHGTADDNYFSTNYTPQLCSLSDKIFGRFHCTVCDLGHYCKALCVLSNRLKWLTI